MKNLNILLGIIFISLILPAALSAQTEMQITVLSNPETPVVGSPWTLTFLIDHSIPEEVNVIAPSFAGWLTLDRYLKSPRGAGTAFEYRFIPSRSGRFTLDAFTFVFPGGIAQTQPIVMNIQGTVVQEPVILRLVWENMSGQPVPGRMAAGERLILILRANPPNILLASGLFESSQQDFFMPEVPPQAILSSIPLTEQEKTGGAVLKLSLIPLEGELYLSARVIRYMYFTFEIPALRIQVISRPTTPALQEQNTSNGNYVPQNEDLIEKYYTEKNYFSRFSLGFYIILIIVITTPFVCLILFRKK